MDLNLLGDVCKHKSVYFESAWARYDEARSGNLKLIPPPHILEKMELDYRAMRQMFFEDPVAWDLIIKEIARFEDEVLLYADPPSLG